MLSLACIALIIDFAFGYPEGMYRRVRHPVVGFGHGIDWLERHLNKQKYSPKKRQLMGMAALVAVALPAGMAGAGLHYGTLHVPGAFVLEILAVAVLLAGRSLNDHALDVKEALEQHKIDEARAAVGKIVGRDTATLDESGIARATIESLSENSSDGLVSPLMWYLVGGLPGIAIFKAVSTADSMIGHMTTRHKAFGWASARADDWLNLPWSRLTALLYALAALMHPRADAKGALLTAWRDAGKHASPNAGWPEAAMAGALGLKLGGPALRKGVMQPGAYLGDGRDELDVRDIIDALALYRCLCILILTALAILAVIAN